MGDERVSALPSLLQRVLADLASETRNPLKDSSQVVGSGSDSSEGRASNFQPASGSSASPSSAPHGEGTSKADPRETEASEPPKYLIYFKLPWRVDRAAFVKALCDAVDISWGVCKKYPFQKRDYDGFWDGFRPRHIFFDTREEASPVDDWSEAVFLGYLPQDDFTEDDRTIVLFLGKLLLSAFSLQEGEYILGDGEILPFGASKAIGLIPDDSAYVMKLIRSGASASIQ